MKSAVIFLTCLIYVTQCQNSGVTLAYFPSGCSNSADPSSPLGACFNQCVKVNEALCQNGNMRDELYYHPRRVYSRQLGGYRSNEGDEKKSEATSTTTNPPTTTAKERDDGLITQFVKDLADKFSHEIKSLPNIFK